MANICLAGSLTPRPLSRSERGGGAGRDRSRKDGVFSNVSPEFRTPLTLMAGPIQEVLEEHTLPEGVRERLELAQRNTLRLQKLVNNLLDFSRIEAGRERGRLLSQYDLATLTQDLVSNFQSAFEKAGLTLEFQQCRLFLSYM